MLGLHLTAWEEELGDDIDCHFILNGIKTVFDINDEDSCVNPVACKNHPSARPNKPLYVKATSQVIKEILKMASMSFAIHLLG